MEIIVSALDIEINALKENLKFPAKYIKCGVKAKNLAFIKELGVNDHITNIGICAGTKIGQLYLCNKINGEKSFYPDIMKTAELPQAQITTIDYLADTKMIHKNPNMLYDQEAYLIFQSAQNFIGPHQINFLKIVSDDGNFNKDTIANNIFKYIKQNCSKIDSYLYENNKIFTNLINNQKQINVKKFSKDLKCSKSLDEQLKQLIKYAICIGFDVDCYFKKLYEKGLIPSKNKQQTIDIINNLKKTTINRTIFKI